MSLTHPFPLSIKKQNAIGTGAAAERLWALSRFGSLSVIYHTRGCNSGSTAGTFGDNLRSEVNMSPSKIQNKFNLSHEKSTEAHPRISVFFHPPKPDCLSGPGVPNNDELRQSANASISWLVLIRQVRCDHRIWRMRATQFSGENCTW
jgi:hypothetical protein